MTEFTVKDSGERLEFNSGMVRDTTEGKINWLLVRPGPMLKRWAKLLTNAAAKYDSTRKPGELRNWQLASGPAEFERFLESADRHFASWIEGIQLRLVGLEPEPDGYDDDGNPIFEDHGAAIFFNVNGAEYVLERLTFELCDYVPTAPETCQLKSHEGKPLCSDACSDAGRCLPVGK